MNFRDPSIIGSAILFLGFAVVAIYEAFGVTGIILLALILLMLAATIWFTYRRGTLVGEMEVGVIFNRFNDSFSRFVVSPESKPVRLKWFEEIRYTIPKKSQTIMGKLENMRTAEGIPVSIFWKVSYTIDVFLISEPIIHKMAHALPEYHNKIVSDRVERELKHVLETRSIQSLYSSDATYGPGVLLDLEREICQRVNRQLSSPLNLGFRELRPKDVSLGPIQMPQTIEKMIELGLQTGIHTETDTESLEQMHKTTAKKPRERFASTNSLNLVTQHSLTTEFLADHLGPFIKDLKDLQLLIDEINNSASIIPKIKDITCKPFSPEGKEISENIRMQLELPFGSPDFFWPFINSLQKVFEKPETWLPEEK